MSSNPYGESGIGLPVGLSPAFDDGRGRGRGAGRLLGRGGRQQRGRGRGGAAAAAQRPPSGHQDLDRNKPWVNGRLAREIWLMYNLKEAAGQTKQNQDFSSFQDQRQKVKHETKLLRDSYFARNPGQEEFWLPILAAESTRIPHICDNCETSFDSEQQLLQHEREQHEICNLDGCTFTASAGKLEIHILPMHSSGLYQRVRQGTADVAKWRAERKRNYPSVAKTQLRDVKADRKRKYIEGLKARRDEIETKRKRKLEELKTETKKRGRKRRPRGTGGGGGGGNDQVVTEAIDEVLPFWFGTMEKFRGTKFHTTSQPDVQPNRVKEEEQQPDFDISDDEWQLSKPDDPKPVEVGHDDDDDEPPEECATRKDPSDEPMTRQPTEQPKRVAPPSGPKAAVMTATTTARKSSFSREEIERRLLQRAKRPPTLLERLLDKEINRERDELVQCLRYVCSRNFFLE